MNGPGTSATGNSTQQHPGHTYTAGGSYTVNLTAGNLFGENSALIATPIEVLNGTRAKPLPTLEDSRWKNAVVSSACTGSLPLHLHHLDPAADPRSSRGPRPATGWAGSPCRPGKRFLGHGDGTLTGTVTDVMLESLPSAPRSARNSRDLEITYALNLSRYPVSPRSMPRSGRTSRNGLPAVPAGCLRCQLREYPGRGLHGDFATANLSGVRGASLNLSAMSSWVNGTGARGT